MARPRLLLLLGAVQASPAQIHKRLRRVPKGAVHRHELLLLRTVSTCGGLSTVVGAAGVPRLEGVRGRFADTFRDGLVNVLV